MYVNAVLLKALKTVPAVTSYTELTQGKKCLEFCNNVCLFNATIQKYHSTTKLIVCEIKATFKFK